MLNLILLSYYIKLSFISSSKEVQIDWFFFSDSTNIANTFRELLYFVTSYGLQKFPRSLDCTRSDIHIPFLSSHYEPPLSSCHYKERRILLYWILLANQANRYWWLALEHIQAHLLPHRWLRSWIWPICHHCDNSPGSSPNGWFVQPSTCPRHAARAPPLALWSRLSCH